MKSVPCIFFVLQCFLQLSDGNTVAGTFFKLIDGDVGQTNKDEPVTSEAFHVCSLRSGCPDLLTSKHVHKKKPDKGGEHNADSTSRNGGNAAEWRKIDFLDIFPIQRENDGIVEVKPRDSGFAQVTVGVQSGKYKIKIVHLSGFFICSPRTDLRSTLGCRVASIDGFWIVVTDINDKIILPSSKGYTLDGNIYASQTKYAIFNDAIYLRKGQQIRFWYKEDLKPEFAPDDLDNRGAVKLYAYAIRQYD